MPENEMKQIRIEKVVLNIGAGGPGENLEKAKNLLENLTDREAKKTSAKNRSAFGVSKGREIGTMVTLRGEEAEDLLERVLKANDREMEEKSFDEQGNFSIGVQEHIDLPGTQYKPEIGIFGLDVTVTLERPGFHVKRRKVPKEIGKDHKISKEEAMDFVEEKFDVNLIGD